MITSRFRILSKKSIRLESTITGMCRFRTVILPVEVTIGEVAGLAVGGVPVVSVACDDADVAVFDTRRFEIIYSLSRFGVAVVKT